jgi:hypothetical protein
MKNDRVLPAEVADLLRAAANNMTSYFVLTPMTESMRRGLSGEITMQIAAHIVVFFLDQDVLDYVDRVSWSDGRDGNFNCYEWSNVGPQPLDLLTREEENNLLAWIKRVFRHTGTPKANS